VSAATHAPRAPGGIGATTGAALKAPPALLPGEHFAAALMFFLMGAVALVAFAPDLARGFFLAPRIAAMTHLFTLGWITTTIMGALYQFLPVALDQPIRSQRIAHATFLLYVPGLLAFATGLSTVRPTLMLSGAMFFGAGVLLFVGNLAATLKRAQRRDVTWWALALATFYLAITLVLGLALTGNLRWGYLGAGRVMSIGVHLHVALAGWVLLVMIGVAHRLLPMFLLSHGVSDHFARAAVALVGAGAGILAFLHHAPPLVSRWLPAFCIAAGCLAFLLQARSYFAGRHRPALDPGMRLAAGALLVLLLTFALAWPVLLTDAPARVAVAYVGSAILAISLFVAAHYYKIVPFLVWYHRFGPLAGQRPVPRVSELYSARVASIAGVLLVTGAISLIAAIAAGAPLAARAAALPFACGAVLECAQMFLLWRTRP
jgi:hypothetical protein